MIKFLLLLLSLFLSSTLSADQIIVEGNKRIEKSTILSYLTFKTPSEYSSQTAITSEKSLYATGLFQNISIFKKNNNITIRVAENPVINKIVFEGNDKVGDDIFEKFFGDRIKSRNIFKMHEIKALTDEILKIYRAQGRFLTKVNPQIIKLKDNRVNVVFKITEGPMALIRQITFIGNKSFSDATLKSRIISREHAWWNFWTNDDIYAPEKIELDKKEIIELYKRNGYVDVQIVSAISELSQDRQSFFITYKIKEGVPYTVDSIDVSSDFAPIEKAEVIKKITQKTGKLYSLDKIQESEEAIVEMLSEKGFIFAEVTEQIIKLGQDRIKIIFKISRGQKIYIGNIRVEGNFITMDSVVRREMTIEEGDPFNTTKLKESNNKIKDLDFFERVDIEQHQGASPDTIDLTINVSEKSTAMIDLGLGVQIGTGTFGRIGIMERNFLGTGKFMAASVEIGQRTRSLSAQFTEPYFMGRKLALTFEAGAIQDKRKSTTSYKESSLYGGLSLGYDISKHLSHTIGYRFNFDKVKDYREVKTVFSIEQFSSVERILLGYPDPTQMTEEDKKNFNSLNQADYGSKVRSKIYSILTYGILDSIIRPRSGYIISLTNSYCGLGGNVRYNSHIINGRYFMPIGKTLTAIIKCEFGLISKKALLTDRFTLGGDDLKGFDYDGAGPRENFGYKYAVRGTRYYVATVALKMPIIEGDMPMDFVVFTQCGALWKSNKSTKFVFDDKKLRGNIGCGIEWQSPMGPIAITYSHPYKKCKYDETQRFQIGYFVTR